jgi:dihydroorotate dehydrogenase
VLNIVKQAVRSVTHWLYAHAVKPILFRRKPDAVHHNLIKLTSIVQRMPLLRELPRLWAHYDDEMLSQTIAGIEFRNPIGLSAGFDKAISMPRMMRTVGFGWMTGGSVTWGQYKGNDGDWFYRLPKTKSLVVNAGLPSEGTEVVSGRIAGYDEQMFSDFPLSVSIAKTNTKATVSEDDAVADYCASLERFDQLEQVKLLEINISCPNTFGGEPFTTPKRLKKLLAASDKLQLKKPVFIKMPINLPLDRFDGLLDVIAVHKVTGVTIGNLHKDRRAVELKDVLPEEVKGNLSGAPARDITTELIRHTRQRFGTKLVIIGVGGVFTAQEAYDKIQAGASLVALITGLIFEGPTAPGQINRDLVRLLRRDGFDTIHDAIGNK